MLKLANLLLSVAAQVLKRHHEKTAKRAQALRLAATQCALKAAELESEARDTRWLHEDVSRSVK